LSAALRGDPVRRARYSICNIIITGIAVIAAMWWVAICTISAKPDAAPHGRELVIAVITGLATALTLGLGASLIFEIHGRARQAAELAAEREKLARTNQHLQDDITRREVVERQLHEAQATLNDAVESISEAFVIYDSEDRFVLCNEAHRRLFPQSRDLLAPGVPFEALLRGGVAAGQYLAAIGREEEWIAEHLERHRRPSGAIEQFLTDGRWLLITERRMRNGGTAGLRIDITRLKATETQLREISDRLDRVHRVAGIGSMEIELPGDRVVWSAGACAIFGVSAQWVESTSDYVLSFVHPDDRARVAEAASRSLASEIATPALEYRINRPDGAERIVYRENALQYGADGRAVRCIATFKDITDLKANELRLREIKRNLDRAQRLAHTGSDLRILANDHADWSDETYRIFGVDPASFIPTTENFMKFVLPQDQATVQTARAEVENGTCPGPIEYRVRRPSGEIRHIRALTELIRDDRGAVIGMAGAVHDVTELRAAEERQKELERQLLHSQKLEALGTLAGGVAHDLNNTLTPILVLTKLVLEDLPAESPVLEEMQMIRQAGERARDLVKQILAFSRKQEIQRSEIDPGPVVAEALQMLRATLPPNVAIVEEIGRTPLIRADAGQLQQVVVNLVTNAAQAIGDADGSVTVAVSTPAASEGARDFVQIRICDTGCGMEQQVVDRIFEPFFTTKGVGEGSGLGLAIVHGIISGHGGRIDVASRPGEGTTFTIRLPMPKPATPPFEVAA
jgi:two-component system, cell cycle sensor histidine kinase and response regulator CckA